jgi:hypothetical protein
MSHQNKGVGKNKKAKHDRATLTKYNFLETKNPAIYGRSVAEFRFQAQLICG